MLKKMNKDNLWVGLIFVVLLVVVVALPIIVGSIINYNSDGNAIHVRCSQVSQFSMYPIMHCNLGGIAYDYIGVWFLGLFWLCVFLLVLGLLYLAFFGLFKLSKQILTKTKNVIKKHKNEKIKKD